MTHSGEGHHKLRRLFKYAIKWLAGDGAFLTYVRTNKTSPVCVSVPLFFVRAPCSTSTPYVNYVLSPVSNVQIIDRSNGEVVHIFTRLLFSTRVMRREFVYYYDSGL